MSSDARHQPRLTPKGERTRTRIVEAAARLIHERSVAGTTLEDVKAAAEVSGSQLYHYFPDKDNLVQAVIGPPGAHHHRQPAASRPRHHRRTPDLARHDNRPGQEQQRQGRLPRSARSPRSSPRPTRAHARRSPLDSASGQPPSATACKGSRPPGASQPAGCEQKRHHSARRAPGWPPARPDRAGHPSSPDRGRHPPRSLEHATAELTAASDVGGLDDLSSAAALARLLEAD